MIVSSYAAWLILGMTLITFFGFRLGGYLIGSKLPRTGRLAYSLDRLPAFVLVALLAPDLWELGWIGAASGAVVLLVTYFSGRALLAMFVGIFLVALARHFNLL